MKKALTLSIIIVGFTAMASQVVLVRELLTVFYGNELSIAFILASWLVGGAIGSAGFGRFSDRIKSKISLFLSCQIILAIVLPLDIVAIRYIRTAFHINPGEIMPLTQMAISAFLVLLPISVILGFMFSLACRLCDPASASPAGRIGRVYILEAAGSAIGGLTVSLFLVRVLGSISIMASLAILNAASSLILALIFKEFKNRPAFLFISGLAFAALVLMRPFGGWERLDRYSVARQWQGYELAASRNSIYGSVAIAKKGDEFSFFHNGLRLYTVPDVQASEEAVHFALLESPDPKDVLLVGGGAGGMAAEALKHPVRSVDYVEMDPLVIDMTKEFLPVQYRKALDDESVSIINLDGRFFIKNTGNRYDCVIMNIGDPLTAETNRYYTAEFFNEVKRLLRDGGILSFGLTSSEDYINAELSDFLRSIHATLKAVFADIKVMPGDTAHFLASTRAGVLTYDIGKLMKRAGERGLDLKFVREYYLVSRLSRQRIDYLNGILMKDGPRNHDFRPIAYYLDIIFWTSYFRDSSFKALLKVVTGHRILVFAFSLAGLIALAGLFSFAIQHVIAGMASEELSSFAKASKKSRRSLGEGGFLRSSTSIFRVDLRSRIPNRRGKDRFPQAALAAIASSGFSMLAFQMVILLAFQIIYGYLFYKLGVLLTSFMIGLAMGGLQGVRMRSDRRSDGRSFIIAQAGLVIYLLVLPLALLRLAALKTGPASWAGANVIFPMLSVMAGLIGGLQFALAGRICLGSGERVGCISGTIYGIDLAGSCLGALATGIFLIPLLGIPHTCAVLAMLNLSILILLSLSHAQSCYSLQFDDRS